MTWAIHSNMWYVALQLSMIIHSIVTQQTMVHHPDIPTGQTMANTIHSFLINPNWKSSSKPGFFQPWFSQTFCFCSAQQAIIFYKSHAKDKQVGHVSKGAYRNPLHPLNHFLYCRCFLNCPSTIAATTTFFWSLLQSSFSFFLCYCNTAWTAHHRLRPSSSSTGGRGSMPSGGGGGSEVVPQEASSQADWWKAENAPARHHCSHSGSSLKRESARFPSPWLHTPSSACLLAWGGISGRCCVNESVGQICQSNCPSNQ